MKKKMNFFKLGLDVLMGITFALLFNKQVLGGLTFHEIAGTAIGVAFLTHISLNWRWVKNITLQLFDRKLPAITRFGYILNVLLLISMTTIIVTGIFISRVLFPGMNIGNEGWFKVTHISLAFVTIILVGVHVGLHWKWVMNVGKKIFPKFKSRAWIGYATKAAAVLILLFGLYEMKETGFVQRVASAGSIFGIQSQSGAMMMHGRPSFEEGEGRGDFDESERPAMPSGTDSEGAGFEKGFEKGAGHGFEGGRGGNANAWAVIASYFGMMAVFVVIVYYLEKWVSRRKRNLKMG